MLPDLVPVRYYLLTFQHGKQGLALFTPPSSLPYTSAHFPLPHPPNIVMSYFVRSTFSLHIAMTMFMLFTSESLNITMGGCFFALSAVAFYFLPELITASPRLALFIFQG